MLEEPELLLVSGCLSPLLLEEPELLELALNDCLSHELRDVEPLERVERVLPLLRAVEPLLNVLSAAAATAACG